MDLPYDDAMGFKLVSQDPVVLTFQTGPSHHNPHHVLHGGVLVGIMDSAMGRHATMLMGECTNAEVHARFLRPVVAGEIMATSRLVKQGGRAVFLEAEVEHNGKTVATASAMFLQL